MMHRRQWLAASGGLIAAALIVIAAPWVWQSMAGRGDREELPLFSAAPHVVIGEVKTNAEPNRISITPNEQHHALIIDDTQLAADQFPVLRYEIERPEFIEVVFAWRLAESPEQSHSISLSDGTFATRLDSNPNWHGAISEVALALRPIPGLSTNAAHQTVTASFSLLPAGPLTLAQGLAGDWLALPGWSGVSINHLGFSWLPAVLISWLVLGAGIAWLLAGNVRAKTALCTVAAGFLICWVLLEGLWLRQLYAQHQATQSRFSETGFTQRLAQGPDAALVKFSRQAVAELERMNAGGRIFFLTPERYFAERGRYLMLPFEVVHLRAVNQRTLERIQPGDALAVSLPESGEIKALLREQRVSFQVATTSKYRELMVIYPNPQKQR